MMLKSNFIFGLFIIIFLITSSVYSQIADFPDDTVAGIPANYTEAKVGQYTLPDPLICIDGQLVKNAETWNNKRRSEIIALFEQNQFGVSPPGPEKLRYEVFDDGTTAFEGKAKRKQVTIYFSDDNEHKMDLLAYLPAKASKPLPVLLYISFRANSVAVDDPGIKEGLIWNREGKKIPASEGALRFKPLNVTDVLEQGIGFATVYYGDIEPDFKEGAAYGLLGLFQKAGETQRKPDDWGAIAAWNWGLSRVMDYFEKDASFDAKRVAVMGVSRLGKTVLWAGALDQRFEMVIPVCSGESGAALSRRNYGETIAHIADPTRFEYWFAPRYKQYANDVNSMPVDAHMLISLIAPRPLLLITGNTDKWSDPYGEFLAALAAEPVYKLLDRQGLETDKMPVAGKAILNDIGFYMHDAGHGMDPTDWKVIFNFMKNHL
jgi:(4-O-methyl)-D-glucuronate---lignin esterase